MKKINSLSAYPYQTQDIVLDDGSKVKLTIYYSENVRAWFIKEITYNDFTCYGIKITNNPNIIHQFRNILPFGLACFSNKDREPFFLEDFANSSSNLYILSEDEVNYLQGVYSGQV